MLDPWWTCGSTAGFAVQMYMQHELLWWHTIADNRSMPQREVNSIDMADIIGAQIECQSTEC